MNVNANIENMVDMYKIQLKVNVLGQSGVKYFYWLEGLRFTFSELGVSKEEVEAMNQEVFQELTEEGHEDLVLSYINEEYETNWNRLK